MPAWRASTRKCPQPGLAPRALLWWKTIHSPHCCYCCLCCLVCLDRYRKSQPPSKGDAEPSPTDLVSAVCSEEWGTPLHLACIGWRPGNATVVTLLLDAGAPVDALNKHGETPLVLAAREGGQPSVVAALLDRGANPCLCSKGGWSPMSAAASRGRDDVVRLLAIRGAPLEEVRSRAQASRPASSQATLATLTDPPCPASLFMCW